MKNLAITTALLSISILTAQAQTEKGTSFIGGAFKFNTDKTENNDQRTYSYTLSPKAGHFISNNFAIGTNLSIGYAKNKHYNLPGNDVIPYDNGNLSLGVAPFARHYLMITERFRFFSEFQLSFTTVKNKANMVTTHNSSDKPYYRNNYYAADLKPGLAFFPTKKLAIEMSFPLLTYAKSSMTPHGMPGYVKSTHDYFAIGLNTTSPLIGLNYHF
ncbi:hypothetical protein [Pedobacter gandavensis]|uniref:hypothetical protein n=1 Tax=Pedobacter gandavensis TaxID=2679963 RepID=UPI002930BAA3|nr:hypothetical protein [Pedobacter gandavensis]